MAVLVAEADGDDGSDAVWTRCYDDDVAGEDDGPPDATGDEDDGSSSSLVDTGNSAS